jgi:nucleotide-binding universal stress UspA family protein
VDGEPFPSLDGAPAHAIRAVEDALETARKGAMRTRSILPGWSVSAIAEADSPAWGIIKESDTWGPDLVVVGSQGRSAIGRLIMGSVSHTVLTEGRCNVRVARGRKVASGRELPRLIIGVDGSPGCLTALAVVAARSWPAGTEALLMCAFDERLSGGPLPTALLGDARLGVHPSEPLAWMRATLEQAADRLRAADTDLAVSTVLEEGDPKHLLVDKAKEWTADSIFLGARGLGTTDRLLLGSVSSTVAMRARCSVEVVYAPSGAPSE